MPFTPNPLLATYLKAFARSVLFSLGLDHVLIDFLANAAVGTVTVLIVIFFVALRIPRRSTRSAPQIRDSEKRIPIRAARFAAKMGIFVFFDNSFTSPQGKLKCHGGRLKMVVFGRPVP